MIDRLKQGDKIRLTMSDGSVYTGYYIAVMESFGFRFIKMDFNGASPMFNMMHIVSCRIGD